MSNTSAPCRTRLLERATRDRFLGQPDERPRLDQLLQELETVLAEGEDKAAAPLRGIAHELARRAGQIEQRLDAIRPEIDAAFATLGTRPGMAAGAAQALRAIGESLARRVRPKLFRLLDTAAPAPERVPKLIAQLEAARRDAIETLPESLWLLDPRRPDVPLEPGRSLVTVRVTPELDALCRGRFGARWRLYRLRRALRREYRLIEIDLRETMTEALQIRSDIQPAALVDRHTTTHHALEVPLQDSWRALRYAIDTSVVELGDDSRHPDAVRIAELSALVTNAMEKTRAAVHDAVTVYPTIFEGIVSEFVQDRANGIASARQSIAAAGDFRQRLRFAVKSARRTVRRRYNQLGALAAAQLALGRSAAGTLARRGEQSLTGIRDRLGFGEVSEEQQLAIADLPSTQDMAERVRALPPIYRRLFSVDPLLNREFLVGRDDELAVLAEAYARWRARRATNIAVVGSEGSGKSSLINCFENEIAEDTEVVHIEFTERMRTARDLIRVLASALGLATEPDSVSALARAVLAGPRRIVVVRRTHNMYLRAVGRAQAPRAFAQVLLATRAHLLWITSCRLYPWRRLDQLFDMARYYTHVLETDLHDEAELREAVLRRQRTTGDNLIFSDQNINLRAIRRLRATYEMGAPVVQKALSELYFETLFRVSGGNLEAAFYFWLLSLRAERSGPITALPVFRLNDRVIRALERLDHFTLAELIGHGHLTADEHAEIFRIDPQRSRLTLENLAQLRIVETVVDDHGNTVRYGVGAVFQQAVAGVLTDLNILN